jgi:hypothetical protein
MTSKASPLKHALKAVKKAMQPQRYGTSRKPFVCHLCGHDRFGIGQILEGMQTLVCADCGHVEFFVLGKMPSSIG